MQSPRFTVTIIGQDGRKTCHQIEAADEESAERAAVIAVGLENIVKVSVAVYDAGTPSYLPAWGWMITATTPNGRIIEQQFLVALEDHVEAMSAAQSKAHQDFLIALGPRVEAHHLLRRKMKRGDVYELGLQRIGRGKKLRDK